MPIEIRELVIKAVVSDSSQQNRVNGGVSETSSTQSHQSEYFENLVQQILEVIQENINER